MINELVTIVRIALGEATAPACPNGVPDDAVLDIAWIIAAVDNGLHGCN